LRAREIKEQKQEAERDKWFNQERPMTVSAKTWKEKRIEKEEQSDDSGDDSASQGKGCQGNANINMVFHLPAKFGLPEVERVRLELGVERAVFEKPVELGKHVKPLYINGHLDGVPINQMLVDGGACANIMPHAIFQKVGHKEEELMKTNMTLSRFIGMASKAKGIISKELTLGSKTVRMTFFVVDVKGKFKGTWPI
jgi:hypothetical protein